MPYQENWTGYDVIGDGVRTITEELVVAATTKDDPSYDAVETILNGPEVSLGDVHYHDKDGNFRARTRIAWWKESATSLSTAALIPGGTDIRDPSCRPTSLLDRRLAEHERFRYESCRLQRRQGR